MAFTTPRRRISPRTRRKYFTIKNFLKRANGNQSQTDNNLNFSGTVNSEDKSKTSSTKTKTSTSTYGTHSSSTTYSPDKESITISKSIRSNQQRSKTKVLFKTKNPIIASDDMSDEQNEVKSKEFKHAKRSKCHTPERIITNNNNQDKKTKTKRCSMQSDCTESQRKKSHKYVSHANVASPSYHSPTLETDNKNHIRKCKHLGRNYDVTYEPVANRYRTDEPLICHEDVINYRSKKHSAGGYKNDFIREVIKKQYRPVHYGHSQCELSQFSAPVCRDKYKLGQIKEDNEIYFTNYDKLYKNSTGNDISDIKSICDTRLYSNKREHTHKRRKKYTDVYNDSNLYDLVPVKEQSSPKTRKRNSKEYYVREVPPSPKTHRPRLNLESHYEPELDPFRNTFTEEYNQKRKKKSMSNINIKSEDLFKLNLGMRDPREREFENPSYKNGDISPDSSPQIEKSDGVLNEIKDVLQTFLQEIKNTTTTANDENSDHNTSKANGQTHTSINETFTSSKRINEDYLRGQIPPCIPPYNPYLQVLPFYPINCMQNAYVVPSNSVLCPKCVHTSTESTKQVKSEEGKDFIKQTNNDKLTEELVKEIYKCVTQNPTTLCHKKNSIKEYRDNHSDRSYKPHKLKSRSRSCNAFGSRASGSTVTRTQGAVSDTKIDDKRSIDATFAYTPTESVSTEESITTFEKKKKSNLQKLLGKFGFTKKKRNKFGNLPECRRFEPPLSNRYGQNFMNYAVHGQEFDNPPPFYPYRYINQYGPEPGTRFNYSNPPINNDSQPHPYTQPNYEQTNRMPHMPYQYGPQPVCLKEIEVRSTATQSDDKIKKTFFGAFRKQTKQSRVQRHTEMQANPQSFHWKKGLNQEMDPMIFQMQETKKLAEGDMKLRNAMLKKLFTKRNPFSKNNIFVKTLMGKDKASFGEPKGGIATRLLF